MIIAKIPATTHGQSAPRVYEGFIITLNGLCMAWELVFGLIERMFEKKSSLEVEKLEFQYFGSSNGDFPL